MICIAYLDEGKTVKHEPSIRQKGKSDFRQASLL